MPAEPPNAWPARVQRLRRDAALSQRALADTLGVSRLSVTRWEQGRTRPSPRLQRRLAALEQSATRVESASAAQAGALPLPLDRLIGRESDLGVLGEALAQPGLLTLSGAGGCGKTRLALAAARAAMETGAFPGGVCFVELWALTAAEYLPQAVARALGVQEQPGQDLLALLVEAMRERRALLVLDNCEHLREPCAALARLLLSNCPRLTILATSRELLGLPGERLRQVEPLRCPDLDAPRALAAAEDAPAVQLFVARAAARRDSFALTAENAAAVAQLCRRLDGLPLALELAAARVATLSVAQIVARLDDRFRLLTGGPRSAPPRQQTLQATIAWSYALLSPAEAALFRALSIVPSSFTLDAAEAIGGAGLPAAETVLDLLGRLIDQSLVVMTEQDGEARYHLLESLRAFGQERLHEAGEQEAALDRLARHCLLLTEALQPRLRRAGQDWAVARISAGHESCRTALRWLAEQQRWPDYFRLATGLAAYWEIQGSYHEAQGWLERGLAQSAAGVPWTLRARALGALGQALRWHGNYARARALHEEEYALAIAHEHAPASAQALFHLALVAHVQGDISTAQGRYEQALTSSADDQQVLRANTLNNLGILADRQGDRARATALLEESAALRRAAGDRVGLSQSLTNLATFAHARGEIAATRALAGEALALAEALGHRHVQASALNNFALADCRAHDYAAAQAHAERARAVYEQTGYQRGLATTFALLGSIARAQGAIKSADDLHRRALAIRRGLGDMFESGESLLGLARVAVAAGRSTMAAWLLGAVARILEQGTLPPGAEEYAEVEAAVRARLDPARFARAFARGAALPLAEVIDEALRPPEADAAVVGGASLVAPHPLTPRERELLRLLATGAGNKAIARVLAISVRTVERELTTLYAKIEAGGRVEAARYALQHGLADL